MVNWEALGFVPAGNKTPLLKFAHSSTHRVFYGVALFRAVCAVFAMRWMRSRCCDSCSPRKINVGGGPSFGMDV